MWISYCLGLMVFVLLVVARLTLSTDLATSSLEEPSTLQLAVIGAGILAAYGLIRRAKDRGERSVVTAPRRTKREPEDARPAPEATRRVA